MQIDYTAQRSLKAGHVVDTVYTINVDLSRQDKRPRTEGHTIKTLSGKRINLVHNDVPEYSLATVIIQTASTPDNDDMVEFLDSVSHGEVFQCDVTGALSDFVLADLRRPYQMTRVGTLDNFRYAFTIAPAVT